MHLRKLVEQYMAYLTDFLYKHPLQKVQSILFLQNDLHS